MTVATNVRVGVPVTVLLFVFVPSRLWLLVLVGVAVWWLLLALKVQVCDSENVWLWLTDKVPDSLRLRVVEWLQVGVRDVVFKTE